LLRVVVRFALYRDFTSHGIHVWATGVPTKQTDIRFVEIVVILPLYQLIYVYRELLTSTILQPENHFTK